MSEVSQVFQKDVDVADVMGVGIGDRTGATATRAGQTGVGSTFLTEPLWGQFVELLTEQSFVRQIARSIPMDQPTLRIPAISSGLSVYATTEGTEATASSMVADDFLLEAKKIMAQVIASAELYEDSVQNIEKIITDDFVRAIAQAEEQAFLLGRVTTTGNAPKGGVSTDNADYSVSGQATIRGLTNQLAPVGGIVASQTFDYADWGTQSDRSSGLAKQVIAGSPLTICDGVITTALDENNVIDMQGASFYGGNAYKAIREAIYKLGLLGRQRRDLVLILNPVSANQLLQSDELMTLDKYGSNATILTGEVGSLFGVSIIESSFVPSAGLTIADGGSANGTYGVGGYGVLVHKPSLIVGDLRKVQVENERIIQNDAFRTVISERIAFGMERRSGAVVIGNMDSSIETLTSSSVFYPAGTAPTLSVNNSAVSIGTSATVLTTQLTTDSTDNSIMYLGSSGLPSGITLHIDPNSVAGAGATVAGATEIADNSVAQVVALVTATPGLAVVTSSATAGTGTIYFQVNDSTGGRSEVVSVTITVA